MAQVWPMILDCSSDSVTDNLESSKFVREKLKGTIKISTNQIRQITAICDEDTNWFSMTMISRYCHTAECRSISHYNLHLRTRFLIMLPQLLHNSKSGIANEKEKKFRRENDVKNDAKLAKVKCCSFEPEPLSANNPLIYVKWGL